MAIHKQKLVAVTALALSISLAGCAGAGMSNRSLDSVHQPVVSQSYYTIDLATADGTLPAGEQQRLSDWLGTMKFGYGDRVSVDDPAPYSNGNAHEAINDIVAKSGMLVAAGAPVTEGQIYPGTVRVVVTRTVAEVPGCPDWSSRSTTDFSSGTSSNYGCAVNSNLAAMVADPTDLIQGKSISGQDPSTAAKAIQVYRDAVPTGKGGLTKNSTKGGN